MPTTKRRAAVYGLESSDPLAMLAGAPNFTVSMPVLAYKKASIENNDVCIGL